MTVIEEELILQGELVRLKPIKSRHFKTITEWYRKKRIRRHLLRDDLPGLKNRIRSLYIKNRIDSIIPSIYRHWLDHGMGFMIKVKQENLGTICVWEIAPSVYRIQIVIGKRKNWGQGFGTEALECVIKYLMLEHYPKSIICADVHPGNHRCIKVFENNGFIKCSDEDADRYRAMTEYPKHMVNDPLSNSGKHRLLAFELKPHEGYLDE